MRDGKALDGLTQTLTKASGWKAAFTNLPGIKDGKKIEYSVVETNTPEGYTSKVEKIDDDNVIKVVNTSNKPTTTTTTTTTVEPKTSSSTTEIQINLVILVPQRHQVRQVQMVKTMGEVAKHFFQIQGKLLHLGLSSLEFLS